MANVNGKRGEKQKDYTEERFLSLEAFHNIEVGSHGLTAKATLAEFYLFPYVNAKVRDSPLLMLLSFILACRGSVWRHPDFIIRVSRQDNPTQSMIFILSIQIHINPQWYTFLASQIKSTQDDKVVFYNPLNFESMVEYIGDKTFTLRDTITSKDGTVLATVRFLYGLAHKSKRNLQVLSESAKSKMKYIKNNQKPEYIKVKELPAENCKIARKRDVVHVENVDGYKHANFAFYYYHPLILFSELQGKNDLKSFTILYKRECRLGAEVESVAWRDPVNGSLCCRTSNGQTLVNYSEGEYYNSNIITMAKL